MRLKKEEYKKGLSELGLEVFSWLEEKNKSKQFLAQELDITLIALNYKMKGKNGGFSKTEVFYLQRLMEEI